jgi:hypothetical protein
LKNRKLKISVLLIATLVATVGIYGIWANVGPKSTGLAGDNSRFSLVRPAFAQSMDPGTTFLDQEAGIAIWLNATADSPLNLTTVQTKMAGNLEQNTSDYIIGSIAVPGLDTDYYPHCFVHKSGWIVVYYPNTDPTSKAISLHTYDYYNINWTTDAGTLETNFLMQALNYTCQNVTQKTSIDNAEYYNFEYPNATAIMIAAKTAGNGGTGMFNFLIPSSFTIDEASWSFYSPQGGSWHMDGNASIHNTGIAHGSISSITTDQYHNVTVSGDTNYLYHNWATVGIIVLYH